MKKLMGSTSCCTDVQLSKNKTNKFLLLCKSKFDEDDRMKMMSTIMHFFPVLHGLPKAFHFSQPIFRIISYHFQKSRKSNGYANISTYFSINNIPEIRQRKNILDYFSTQLAQYIVQKWYLKVENLIHGSLTCKVCFISFITFLI